MKQTRTTKQAVEETDSHMDGDHVLCRSTVKRKTRRAIRSAG